MEDVAIGGREVEDRTGATSRGPASDDDFRMLFDSSYAAVVRTVHHILGDRAVAEEIAQEAFIQLHLHWRQVRRYDAPGMWVRRVAIRKAQRERHRIWRRTELEQSLDSALTTGPPADPLDQVYAAVQTLPFKQRALVVLFYLEDRPMDEVVQLLGCSMSSGWSLLHVARKKLAVLLAEEVDEHVR
jgi:RNA polymerase sigma-70 factor (ECF subfamily)